MNATQNLIERLLVGIKEDKKVAKDNKNKNLIKILNNSIFTIYKQLTKSQKIGFENALINNSVFTKEYIKKIENNKLGTLKEKLSNPNLSKSKHKKLNKRINKFNNVTKPLHDIYQSYFNLTPSGKIKSITTNQTINLLEELQEYFGAVDLPSEQLAKKSQKEFQQNK